MTESLCKYAMYHTSAVWQFLPHWYVPFWKEVFQTEVLKNGETFHPAGKYLKIQEVLEGGSLRLGKEPTQKLQEGPEINIFLSMVCYLRWVEVFFPSLPGVIPTVSDLGKTIKTEWDREREKWWSNELLCKGLSNNVVLLENPNETLFSHFQACVNID